MIKARGIGLVAFVFIAVAATACNETSLPTAPPPVPPAPPPDNTGLGAVYGAVLAGQTRTCLAGATIEVLDGPKAGERVQQSATDCELLNDVSVYSFIVRDVPRDRPVTLRASMPGYESQTLVSTPVDSSIFYWWGAVEIRLSPLP
jgi:hypothetical protein